MTLSDPTSWETNPNEGDNDDNAGLEISSNADVDHSSDMVPVVDDPLEGQCSSNPSTHQDAQVVTGVENDIVTNGGDGNEDTDDRQENRENEDDPTTSLNRVKCSDIMYSIEAYGAIVSPVAITMVLSALAVVYFNSPETLAAGETAFSLYNIIELEEDNSAQNLGASLVNTLVFISVICFVTFVIVSLYKYKCMIIFYGYMVVVTALLLGYFTTNMFIVATNIYELRVDKLSLYFVMYNYAIVGTLAIFYQRGIPQWVTQGYLVTSSVCLAWQFSYFNEWMAWTLLVMLAFYDLFAVLSPYGPLKALAKLISKPGAAQLHGLLYEAPLPNGVQKPKRSAAKQDERFENTASEEEKKEEDVEALEDQDQVKIAKRFQPMPVEKTPNQPKIKRLPATNENLTSDRKSMLRFGHGQSISESDKSTAKKRSEGSAIINKSRRPEQITDVDTTMAPANLDTTNTGLVPLALAKLYNLNILDPTGSLRERRFSTTWKQFHSSQSIREGSWSSKQSRSEVTAIFPPRGGVISRAEEQKHEAGVAYVVRNRSGEEMRKFVVTREGKVMQVLRRDPGERREEDDQEEPSSIKLGIGDFVFYSVLVSKAAQYSFTTFVTCFFVVLFGLAGTLVILALKGKALPALPISIGLGVLVFLGTKELIQPWIQTVLRQNFFV